MTTPSSTIDVPPGSAGYSLSGFTDDLHLGSGLAGGSFATANAPALAQLSTGGFVAAWQGADTVAGGAGAGLRAQLRDASGGALGNAFALTPDGDARVEGEPAVAALADGRFAVAYAVQDHGMAKIAYRVAAANGAAGVEHVVAAGLAGDAAMPAVATLSDGSFALAWRAGGAIHVQRVGADGNVAGAVQDYAALGSAQSPSLAPLGQGGYVVSWGEMNDGNVYAATSSAHAPFVVGGDGYAASVSTAAPLPHAAALADGGFVVAWDSYVNEPRGFTMSDIFFQRYDAAAHAAGTVVQANVDSTGCLFDAAVTGLSTGGFLVAWQGSGDDGNGIHGRRFGADGHAVDDQDIRLSARPGGEQACPDVVALSGGGFAAAWRDTAADGSVSVEARVLPGSGAPAAPASAAGSVAKLAGSHGADALRLPSGASQFDGGDGIDTLLVGGARAAGKIVKTGAGFALTDAAGNQAALVNVERIHFSDGDVALDIDGNAGQAYRLYQAAFKRVPDKAGLGYWIDALDGGGTLADVAAAFTSSAEFATLYGAHSTDAQFVDALYHNALHRAPDAGGFDYWMGALHTVSRGAVLVCFGESQENQLQVIGSIQNGIDYIAMP